MKILHYRNQFSLPSETFIYDLICNLELCGIDNYVLTQQRILSKERKFPKIIIVVTKISFLKRVYGKLFLTLKQKSIRQQEAFSLEIEKYIKKISPDIIHAHFGIEGVLISHILQKFNLNIPLVISFHGFDVNVVPKSDKVYLQKLQALNTLDINMRITTPSQFLKKNLIALGVDGNKIEIIPNSYNQYFENIIKNNYWKYGETLKLLNVGRFTEVKGQQYLLSAFAKIITKYPNSLLTIIGYGELEKELKNRCIELGITDKVNFIIQVEHSKLPQIMTEHDIYIQPSIIAKDGAEENLSVATIEAQVCGLPSIVSNIGGLIEIVINNVTGILVEQKNKDELFYAIKKYIDNPDLIKIHSVEATKYAKERFNKSRIMSKVIKLYKNTNPDNLKN